MWQLWTFGILFVVFAGVIFLFDGWAEHMGNPDQAKPGPMLLAAAIASALLTLIAAGVGSLFQ